MMAGRPRKENVERYPSGKITKAEVQREAMSTVIDARQRIFGVTKENARSSYSGHVLGRLFLDRKITEAEMDAGIKYAEAMARYYWLTGIQFPSARAQELFSIHGFDGEVSESRAQQARNASDKMMAMEGVLLNQRNGPQIKTTVFNTAFLDLDALRLMPDQQLGWLKCGLRELAVYFQAQIS